MKSLLTVLVLAIALGVGYWNFRGSELVNSAPGGATAGAGLLAAIPGFKQADTSRLEADLATSRAELARNATELADTREALSQTRESLGNTRVSLGETRESLALAEQSLEQNSEGLEQVMQRLSAAENKLAENQQAQADKSSEVEKQLQALSEQHGQRSGSDEQHQNRISELEGMLSTLDEKIASLGSDISKNKAAVDQQISDKLSQSVDSKLSEQQAALEKFDADFDKRATEAVAADISSLQQQLSTAASTDQLQTVSASVKQLEQQLTGLQEQASATESSVLAKVQSELSATVASLGASIDENRKSDTDNNSRLLRQSVNRLENQIKAISATSGEAGAALELSNALDGRIDKVENALAGIADSPALQSRHGQVNARINKLAKSMEGMEETVDSVQRNIGGLESNLETSVQDSVAAAAKESELMREQLDAANEKVALLEATVKQLQESNAEDEERSVALSGRVESLENTDKRLLTTLPKIDAIEQNTFSADKGMELSEKVDAIEITLANMDDSLAAIKSSTTEAVFVETEAIGITQNRIQEQLTNLEGKVSGAPSPNDITGIENQLTQSKKRIEQLEDRLTNLSGSTAETTGAEAFQVKLQQQIGELEKRLAEQTKKPRKHIKPNEYKIYFGKDSSSISGDAEKVLKSFISQEQNRASSVSIFGFTDRSGDAGYNQRLALRRANRVRSFLIQQGFDFRKINAVDGLGEDPAASKLEDGEEDANQRTVVLYAHQK